MRHGRGRSCVAFLFLCLAAAASSRSASAATDDDLEAARHLFKEAVVDENKGQYETALAKFRRVQNVKDTANVRYRIATCLEQLGQRANALAAYEGAALIGEADKTAVEVVRASHDKVTQLNRIVARLTIVLSPRAPADADVRVDEARIAPAALAAPITVDPGPHTISATARDAAPFHTSITLPEGGNASVLVPLDPPAPAPGGERPIEPRGDGGAAPQGANGARPPPRPPPTPQGSVDRTAGIVTTSVGGVLVAAAGVTFAIRHGDISKLDTACPGGQCPASQDAQRSELTSTRSRALTETTVATVLGIAGAAAVGVGIYLIVSAEPSSSTSSTGSGAPHRASIGVAPVLSVHGPAGAAFTVRGTF